MANSGEPPALDAAVWRSAPTWQVGLVGFAYRQVMPDGGSGDRVRAFGAQVFRIGPQIGHVFPVGQLQGYLYRKGYKEFGLRNRQAGLNVWLTFALSRPKRPWQKVNGPTTDTVAATDRIVRRGGNQPVGGLDVSPS